MGSVDANQSFYGFILSGFSNLDLQSFKIQNLLETKQRKQSVHKDWENWLKRKYRSYLLCHIFKKNAKDILP